MTSPSRQWMVGILIGTISLAILWLGYHALRSVPLRDNRSPRSEENKAPAEPATASVLPLPAQGVALQPASTVGPIGNLKTPSPPAVTSIGVSSNKQPSAPVSVAAQYNPREAIATEQMIAAHASLRAPEVADPDSVANRKILQDMILKALVRKARH